MNGKQNDVIMMNSRIESVHWADKFKIILKFFFSPILNSERNVNELITYKYVDWNDKTTLKYRSANLVSKIYVSKRRKLLKFMVKENNINVLLSIQIETVIELF